MHVRMLLQTDLGDSRAVLQNGSQICFTQDSQAEPKNDSNLSLLASTSAPAEPAPTIRYPARAAGTGHSSAGSMLINKVVSNTCVQLLTFSSCVRRRLSTVLPLPLQAAYDLPLIRIVTFADSL